MARQKLKAEDTDGEIKPIDAKRACQILRQDILPNITKIGERSQEVSTAYKAVRKECNIPTWVMKLGIKLKDTEDFKRDHELRAMKAVFEELGISIRTDMVDMAEGKSGDGSVVGTSQSSRPRLVTVSDGMETDLADAADDVDEFDAAAPEAVAAE